MPYVPIGKNTSKRLSGLIPDLDMVNLYAEATEANQVKGYDLLTRPCLQHLATPAGGVGRGVFYRPQGSDSLGGLYALNGVALRRVDPTTGATSNAGAVSGVLPAQMAFGNGFALIASGDVLQSYDGTGMSNVPLPDGQLALGVVFLNGYFIVLPFGSQYLYYSDPTKLPGDPDFFTGDRRVGAILSPGESLRIETRGEELHVFKEDGYELFLPTGQDEIDEPPFQRVDGRSSSIGVASPYTVVQIQETILRVGQDCAVYDMRTLSAISTPSINQRIADAARLGVLLQAWGLSWSDHDFYILSIGTTSLVYDLSTGVWSEWTSPAGNWRPVYGVQTMPGVVIAQDGGTTGELFRVTDALQVDVGDTTFKQRGTGVLPLTSRQIISAVSLDCAVGVGSADYVELFTSSDQGRTYDSHGTVSIGASFIQRVRWTRLGQFEPPLLMFAFESDNVVRWRFSNMRANDPF